MRLEESRIDNDELSNNIQSRLFSFIRQAAGILDPIPETTAITRLAVTERLIPDPTDNLILHSILDHARGYPEAGKALLTDNTKDFDTEEVRVALAAAGISRPFRSVTNMLGWLKSRTQ
ncbi:PIN domain-containing protein [Singulisphaera rosea]